ncbi:MAG: hypothetical protein UY07_C0009G0008 [Parcubacteria group bacterium GW2011_GWA1_47_8]|nr:MAG: hypothetical protein UY07_C0009G0008 [Parcubacteria group bacterium GW2011_GWA1_47_8]KKW07921.1 MAG: hypothetical protein UY42_C0003G0013 [Parcubacteria group bacterium GW2011_GWA2_49_16]
MKYIFLVLIFFVSGVMPALGATTASVKNAGFAPAIIWYSKDSFFAGDKVRVYTIVFNGSVYTIAGSVEFLDNGKVIDSTNFSLSGGGHVRDVWVDWVPALGSHAISARIVNAIFTDAKGVKQTLALESVESSASERVVGQNPNRIIESAKATSSSESGSQIVGAITQAVETVNNAIPVPVKMSVVGSANTVEKFRANEAAHFRAERENQTRILDALNMPVSTSTATSSAHAKTAGITEKPFAYFLFFLYAGLQYFFQWQILFYGLSLYVIYRLTASIVRRVRNRNRGY